MMIRDTDSSITTLAVGDGANDVNMITAAHVGVGISGLEGQQAARSSDFAIGQFQFLRPLLFVHGREAYRRNSFLVCYNFYKNILFVVPQYWFGFMSVFSGQTLYEPWIYQLYNIVFTALPIMWFALFDFERTKDDFLRRPGLYQIGLRSECFGTKIFWKWIGYGAFQALIILCICLIAFDLSVTPEGMTTGLWVSGAVVYAGIVLVANVKLLDSMSTHDGWGDLMCVASIVAYWVVLFVMSRVPKIATLYGVFDIVLANPVTYFSQLFVMSSIWSIDLMIFHTKEFVKVLMMNKEQREARRRQRELRHSQHHVVGKMQTIKCKPSDNEVLDKGYAFSEENKVSGGLKRGLREPMVLTTIN